MIYAQVSGCQSLRELEAGELLALSIHARSSCPMNIYSLQLWDQAQYDINIRVFIQFVKAMKANESPLV
jgi:hypothetical protein